MTCAAFNRARRISDEEVCAVMSDVGATVGVGWQYRQSNDNSHADPIRFVGSFGRPPDLKRHGKRHHQFGPDLDCEWDYEWKFHDGKADRLHDDGSLDRKSTRL